MLRKRSTEAMFMPRLSRSVLAVLILLISCAAVFSQAGAMTNDEVVSLSKAGLSTDVIVAKIKTTPANFDTSSDRLKALKEAGVADAVILAMVQYPLGSASVVAETGDEAVPGETMAIVYVYRKKDFQTRNMQPSVYVDGAEVARIDDGKFFLIRLGPGKHTVTVNKDLSGGEVDMKAGHKYYFRVAYKVGFWKAHSEIEFIAREQARVEVGNMKPLDDKWIKDKARVTTKESAAP